MINTHTYGGETWVDIDSGTPEEIHGIMDTYHIHPFVAKELTSVTPKPRVEFHKDYIYCIMHFPAWKHTHGKDKNQEVDFINGKDTLITARYDTIDAFHKLGKDLEVDEILYGSEKNKDVSKNSDKKKYTHFIFTTMLRGLYTSLFEELEYVDDMTEAITSKIFKGKEREMVARISEVTRTLLNFKRVTDMHREILETLRSRGIEMFGENFGYDLESIILDYTKINTTILKIIM